MVVISRFVRLYLLMRCSYMSIYLIQLMTPDDLENSHGIKWNISRVKEVALQ